MRIISNFHDYYDTVRMYGIDPQLIYERLQKELELTIGHHSEYNYWRWEAQPQADELTVGFCGILYGCLRMWQSGPGIDKNVSFLYTVEQVDEFVAANFKKRVIEHYHTPQPKRGKGKWWRYKGDGLKRYQVVEFFDKYNQQSEAHTKFFLDHHTPVFISGYPREEQTIINGCLKDVQFFKVFDAYTAYQELAMYLGNMGSPEKALVEIADEDMAACKGYDEWSFRKLPGGKKRRKHR